MFLEIMALMILIMVQLKSIYWYIISMIVIRLLMVKRLIIFDDNYDQWEQHGGVLKAPT